MSETAPITSIPANRLAAFSLPVFLLAFGSAIVSAQCSQATQPKTAPSAQPPASAQSNPPLATSAEPPPASETPGELRFLTGQAVTVLEDTSLQVMNDMPISSRTARPGAKLSFTITRDVVVDGILVIPCGATVIGTVAEAKQAGRLVGASTLTLQLTALNLGDRSYPLYTPPFKVVGTSKTSPTIRKMTIGAAAGTLAADASVPPGKTYTVMDGGNSSHQETQKTTAAQRAEADALGAGVGAGIGVAVAAATPPSIALLPAESQMEFTLASPIAVYPVDQRTAMHLAQGMRQGGPVLYVRGETQ